MTGLTEQSTWEDEVYQIETSDPVVAGPPNVATKAGVSNIPHAQLANRTKWLKEQLEAINLTLAAINAAYVTQSAIDSAISDLINGAPGALDTLKELADALTDNDSEVAALTALVAGKLGTGETAYDSDRLDGKAASFFQDAANLISGTVPLARLPLASDTARGVSERATYAEALAGTDNARHMTPYLAKQVIDSAIAALVDGAPAALDTLKELADELANNDNAIASLVSQLASHSHAFDDLTGKTSATGEFSTNGNLVSGRGSGGVALTINDGYGNANVAFNHKDGLPEQDGNAARIEVNTDATTSATMIFSLKSNVTEGEAVNPIDVVLLTEAGLQVNGVIDGDTVTGAMIASQAEAEGGTNNNHIMTPLRVQNAISKFAPGLGQSWQDMSASRLSDLTVYQNTSGKPISVSIDYRGDFNSAYFEVSHNNVDWVRVYYDDGDGAPVPMTGIIVPNNHYYRSSTSGGNTDPNWFELR